MNRRSLLLAGAGLAIPRTAAASSSLSVVVPHSVGGSADIATRLLARRLQDLHPPVNAVVSNRSGGNAVEGSLFVARSTSRDTLLSCTPSGLLFVPARQDVGYTRTNFEPVAMWGSSTFALAVHADSRLTMRDLLERPGRLGSLTVGGAGSGTEYEHFISVAFGANSNPLTWVGYRGGGDVLAALLGKHIDVAYLSVASSIAAARNGQIRYLCHTSEVAQTLRITPSVPHASTFGITARQVSFHGLVAPRGWDSAAIARVADAVRSACMDASFVAENEDRGLSIRFRDSGDFGDYMAQIENEVVADFKRWNPPTR